MLDNKKKNVEQRIIQIASTILLLLTLAKVLIVEGRSLIHLLLN